MDDLTGYDLIEYWDVTIEQQMPDGTLQSLLLQATIKWFDNRYFEGFLVNQQRNVSCKVLSGCAYHGPYRGYMSFDVLAADGIVRYFNGDIIDEWSILGCWGSKEDNEQKDVKARWKAIRYKKICHEDEECDDQYDDNEELSPSEIPCPFCSTRGKQCSHLLADFDRTFADQGKYRIGLGGGTLYEVEEIGELFETIADCYARTRYMGKKTKLPIGPKGTTFQAYVREIKRVRLNPKIYKSEEDYCWDFRANIECYADLVRGVLLELIDCEIYERAAADNIPLASSSYTLWYCSDANAAAAKLKYILVQALSDFKRENGFV